MEWPERMVGGFSAAATACGDRTADSALPGLHPDLRARLAPAMAQLGSQSRQQRLAALTSVTEPGDPGPDPHMAATLLPPRALGLLAARVPREVGRQWLQQAPPTRRGYAPPRALVDLLLRMAGNPQED